MSADDALLRARISVPDHVVLRRFADDCIALNLSTGQYHGLNETAAAMLDARWSAAVATRISEERFDAEPAPARSIDHVAGVGYRLYARHFGLALVSEDGALVLCAPPDDEPWSWQRFLVGRVLPWAAVLRGREVFHAAAVTIDGRAVALVGQSGVGKSSLAAHLVLEGAGFLTDDVLAVDRDAGTLRAHPGAGILCVRPAERAAM